MRNINIEIPEELHQKIKMVCATNGMSVKEFVLNSLGYTTTSKSTGDLVNINIQIPEELHKRMKMVCAVSGKTMKDFVVDILDCDNREREGGKSG